jgi:hypothetical protein
LKLLSLFGHFVTNRMAGNSGQIRRYEIRPDDICSSRTPARGRRFFRAIDGAEFLDHSADIRCRGTSCL